MCASRVSFCVAYARYTKQQDYFSMLSEKYERQEDMLYYM